MFKSGFFPTTQFCLIIISVMKKYSHMHWNFCGICVVFFRSILSRTLYITHTLYLSNSSHTHESHTHTHTLTHTRTHTHTQTQTHTHTLIIHPVKPGSLCVYIIRDRFKISNLHLLNCQLKRLTFTGQQVLKLSIKSDLTMYNQGHLLNHQNVLRNLVTFEFDIWKKHPACQDIRTPAGLGFLVMLG
jgi:hypothetical protein